MIFINIMMHGSIGVKCGTEMVDRLLPMEHITIEINIRKFILGYFCLEDHTHRFALLKILMHTEDENVLLGMLGTDVHYVLDMGYGGIMVQRHGHRNRIHQS